MTLRFFAFATVLATALASELHCRVGDSFSSLLPHDINTIPQPIDGPLFAGTVAVFVKPHDAPTPAYFGTKKRLLAMQFSGIYLLSLNILTNIIGQFKEAIPGDDLVWGLFGREQVNIPSKFPILY